MGFPPRCKLLKPAGDRSLDGSDYPESIAYCNRSVWLGEATLAMELNDPGSG